MNNILKLVTSFQHYVEHEIKKAIQKLKYKKVSGVYGTSAEFYKYGCNELLPALESLFNTILTNGEYPSRWATGIVHPVHKKGDYGVPDNFRKIMPCIGNYLNLYLITDSHLKTKYVMIMIPTKRVLKAIRELRTIYSYYVPS